MKGDIVEKYTSGNVERYTVLHRVMVPRCPGGKGP
jgi:hypothetical protein